MEEVKIRAPRTVIGDFIVGVNAMKAAHTARKQGVSGLRITPIRAIPSVKLGLDGGKYLAIPQSTGWNKESCKGRFQFI